MIVADCKSHSAFAAIAARCESLGRNCEFGLLQRFYGCEPIGLLRWASSPVEAVIRGLRTRFAGIGQDVDLHVDTTGEWLVTDRSTDLIFHSNLKADRAEAEVRRQEARRLPRLAGRLLEDITAGEKALVYSSADWSRPTEGYALLAAIRDIGSGPVLLVAQNEAGFDSLDWQCWGATLPRLTHIEAALYFDVAGWGRILQTFGDAIASAQRPDGG